MMTDCWWDTIFWDTLFDGTRFARWRRSKNDDLASGDMGGPEMAPKPPQRSEPPGQAGGRSSIHAIPPTG